MKKLILLLLTIPLSFYCLYGQLGIDYNGNPSDNTKIIGDDKPAFHKEAVTTPIIIINVIPSPTQSGSINDIAFDGMYLWALGYDEYYIHQISPVDGTIIHSIPTDVRRPHGLTFDGSSLWLSDGDNKIIQKIDPTNGDVLQSFRSPADTNQSYTSGLAWDGQHLWNNDPKGTNASVPGDSTFKINTTGTILQSFQAFGEYPSGLAHDGEYLWSADNDRAEVYKIYLSPFTVIDTIDAPGGDYPNGLAWDGHYLWISNNQSDSIYQVDVDSTAVGIYRPNKTVHHFSVFPNPSSGKFVFSSNEAINKRISSFMIYNMNGQLILEKAVSTNHFEVDLSDYKSGTYFYSIQFEDGSVEKGRVVKR